MQNLSSSSKNSKYIDKTVIYQESIDEHQEFIFPCVTNYYLEPIVITKAKNLTITDIKGYEYLDFFGGILTVSLGHCNEYINKAINEQLKILGHTSTLYITKNMIEVAKKLAKITPGKLKKCFFSNSGTEANETAVMLAKIHTKHNEIIVLRHSYSGRSQLATNMTGNAPWRVLQSSIAGVKHAHAPYCYRCPMKLNYPSCDLQCAVDIKELIETETCGKIAAFLAEPIQGVGGFITPPNDYFGVAINIIRNYGGLFICDEVQTGLGRTGEYWFGIEQSKVEPEIMTIAKGIANGIPVGVTIAKENIANSFTSSSICTFGGNPISMTAAKTTLEIMEEKNIKVRAFQLGTKLKNGLKELQKDFSFIGDVRGKGLMLAIELVENKTSKEPSPKKTNALMEASKNAGLLLGKGGLYNNVIRIAPPMLISENEINSGLKKLEQALKNISNIT